MPPGRSSTRCASPSIPAGDDSYLDQHRHRRLPRGRPYDLGAAQGRGHGDVSRQGTGTRVVLLLYPGTECLVNERMALDNRPARRGQGSEFSVHSSRSGHARWPADWVEGAGSLAMRRRLRRRRASSRIAEENGRSWRSGPGSWKRPVAKPALARSGYPLTIAVNVSPVQIRRDDLPGASGRC